MNKKLKAKMKIKRRNGDSVRRKIREKRKEKKKCMRDKEK